MLQRTFLAFGARLREIYKSATTHLIIDDVILNWVELFYY